MNTDDITLPVLGEDRIDGIETVLFRRIAAERDDALADARRARARAVRRGRIWMGAAAAASVVAVAAIIAPQLGVGVATTADRQVSVTEESGAFGARDAAAPATMAGGAVADSAGAADRSVIGTASATVQVDDARAAVDAVAAATTAAGGRVESMTLTGTDGVAGDGAALSPASVPGAVIVVRVPAATLPAALQDLEGIGEVTASQIDRRDVTTESVDLRARVGSLEASVTRLTELLAQSTSTADLIAAESALAQRQADLESLRQQLAWLDDQVEMSSLTVTLVEPVPGPSADPAGFADGLAAGWNGLVSTLNGVVVGLGFVLPWLAIAAVAAGVVWVIRSAAAAWRGRRQRPSQPPSTGSTTPET